MNPEKNVVFFIIMFKYNHITAKKRTRYGELYVFVNLYNTCVPVNRLKNLRNDVARILIITRIYKSKYVLEC